MNQPVSVTTDQLRTLAGQWSETAWAIGANPAADPLDRSVASMPGSHTAWVCAQVAEGVRLDLEASARRVAALVDAAGMTGAGYDAVDQSTGTSFDRLGG